MEASRLVRHSLSDLVAIGDGTMSMMWMRMPGQTWLGAAASFLMMWIPMLAAMMLPALVPMLWRYRKATVGAGAVRRSGLSALVGVGCLHVSCVLGALVFPVGATFAALEMRVRGMSRLSPIAVGVVVLVAGWLLLSVKKRRDALRCRISPQLTAPVESSAAPGER